MQAGKQARQQEATASWFFQTGQPAWHKNSASISSAIQATGHTTRGNSQERKGNPQTDKPINPVNIASAHLAGQATKVGSGRQLRSNSGNFRSVRTYLSPYALPYPVEGKAGRAGPDRTPCPALPAKETNTSVFCTLLRYVVRGTWYS